MTSSWRCGASERVAALAFKCVLDARKPIAGISWLPCLQVLRVFQGTGRELLIDIPGDSVRGCKDIAAVEGAEELEWSPCGRYGAVKRAGQLAVWNSQKNKVVPSPPSAGVVERLAWRPNPQNSEGELWLAGSMGLAIWSADGDFRGASEELSSETAALAWDPTGTYLARACKSGGLFIWNARTNKQARLERAGEHPIRELAWNLSGATLAGASTDSLFVWSIPAALHGKTHARLVRQVDAPVSRIAFRPRSNILAVGKIDGGIELLNAVGSDEAPRCAQLYSAVSHVAWSPHGKQLAVATSSGQVYTVRVCK